MTQEEQLLQSVGVRLTAVRLLVWRQIARQTGTFCLADLEGQLPTVDRSTLFRALTLFADHHLLHVIDDGSGSQKYCVCHCDDRHHHHGHLHFSCVHCQTTYCLHGIFIPEIELPEGFEAGDSEFIIKGICPECKRKGHHLDLHQHQD